MRQKYSKYAHSLTKSDPKKINFGSASVKRRPISLAKVKLKEYDDLVIRCIEPTEGPKEDEMYSWGLIRFSNMTRKEIEDKFGIIN